MSSERIAVIGGGVSGVATVAALRSRGLECVAFEKQPGPGGLWYSNYPGAKIQTGAELYEFPDKQFPEAIRSRDATAEEVCQYLNEYIDEQGIGECFRYNVDVSKVTREAEDKWTVHYDGNKKEKFSFVVICTGLHSGIPNKIDLPGIDDFEKAGGTVMHSSERKSNNEFKDKKVVVVGNGKSAMDAALAAGKVAKESGGTPPVQVVRSPQWYFPKYLFGRIHVKTPFLCRFGGTLLPRYYLNDSWLYKLAHGIAAPLKFFMWRVVGILYYLHYRLPLRLLPPLGTIEGCAFNPSNLVVMEEHLRPYRSGEVKQFVATVDKLKPGKVVLSTGQVVDADTVVLATGWKTGLGCLDQSTVQPLLDFEDDGLWLYRHVLPPKTKGLAFVCSVSFTTPVTCFIQACWLADLLAGTREWPSEKTMLEDVENEKTFRRAVHPHGCHTGMSVYPYILHHHDVLLRDMGIDPLFDSGLVGLFRHWMLPTLASSYDGILIKTDSQKVVRKRGRNSVPMHAVAGIIFVSILYHVLA